MHTELLRGIIKVLLLSFLGTRPQICIGGRQTLAFSFPTLQGYTIQWHPSFCEWVNNSVRHSNKRFTSCPPAKSSFCPVPLYYYVCNSLPSLWCLEVPLSRCQKKPAQRKGFPNGRSEERGLFAAHTRKGFKSAVGVPPASCAYSSALFHVGKWGATAQKLLVSSLPGKE